MDKAIPFPVASARFRSGEPLVISCDDCVMRLTSHCHDCMVSYLCEGDGGPSRQVSLSGDETEAVGHLMRAGLVPQLRFSLVG
jgi:hypothetical protein